MKLEKHLVLNKYFLGLFGSKDFNELREKLKDTEEGYDTQGRSYFVDVLIGLKPEWESKLLRYDEAIRKYVERLRQNRRQPNFNLKYFQYLAVLFTEIFLDKYSNDRQKFLNELNEFLEELNNETKAEITRFTEEDLKKLAFWMATGSGKTLIMHINYWQILKYSKNDWDNIILITPNEGLSKQHQEELKLSGIPCKLYDGNIDNLKTRDKEILVIDIHKLTEEKKGEGVSVDISYFDGKNLVFIDEGHKGQKSEEQTWKRLRENIGENGFLFEYSATFGQVWKDVIEYEDEKYLFRLGDREYKYVIKKEIGREIKLVRKSKEVNKKGNFKKDYEINLTNLNELQSTDRDMFKEILNSIDINNDIIYPLEEYPKAIIFNYSYKYFYGDGYGKDFYIYNIQAKKEGKKDVYTEGQKNMLLIAGLLSFYEQLELFEKYKEELREYNIEKPLWIFIGSKVTGKGINSDVVKVIQFLDKITNDEAYLKENIKKILEGKSGLIDNDGNDIFKGKFEFVKRFEVNSLVENIYQKVFGGKGRLELYEIKNADGELGLKTSTAEKYFGVINVGNVRSLKKLISESEIEVKEDHFSQSLFFGINESNSHINILIGSKKFIEGWNSWRVSNMGLINMGKSEGPQIIQLFGRGVRLKGKDYSLKREENPDYKLKMLQTLFIFGLNSDYINAFLTTIEKEEVDYEEIAIPIKFNKPEKWEGKIYTIKTRDDFDFLNHPIKLTLDENILRNIKIDLRPKITIAHGSKVRNADTVIDEPITIPEEYFEFIDWDYVYYEIMNYKIAKGMYNLIVDIDAIMQIVKSGEYKIFLSESEGISVENSDGKPVLKIYSFDGVRKFHEIILMVVKNYIIKFYRKEEKRKTMDYLEVEPLTINEHPYMYPEDKKIILKIQKNLTNEIKEVLNQLEEYDPDSNKLPDTWKKWDSFIVYLDNHLYTPLIIWKENKEEIKSIPVKLNKGETKFVRDFKNFLDKNKDLFENNEIFLLRNLSRKGIGFFISSGFYPDFIIWVRKENKQHMIFIDPKGLLTGGVRNFNHDKIQLCVSYIKDINRKINEELKNRGENVNLQLDAFILSVSSYNAIKDIFGESTHTKKEFEEHNIVFQEDSGYLKKIFEKVGVIEND